MAVDNTLVEKSMRSVFVGNIPYDVTDDRLKEIFGQVGPVLSFRMMTDRTTGKPKGYGFCEFRDPETALSAMRNLNGYEIGGRSLRVDNACTEKSRMEMQTLMQGPAYDSPYGEEVKSSEAPEAITKAVASLPPEQMFELMKQMKACIQNNPAEARSMLLQNPQLAYALLQAQVIMRIVDPHTAATMLHKSQPSPEPLQLADNSACSGVGGGALSQPPPATQTAGPTPPSARSRPTQPPPLPVDTGSSSSASVSMMDGGMTASFSTAPPPQQPSQQIRQQQMPPARNGPFGHDVDFRQSAEPGVPIGSDQDMRRVLQQQQAPPAVRAGGAPANARFQHGHDQDLRMFRDMPPRVGGGGAPGGAAMVAPGRAADVDLRAGDRDMRANRPMMDYDGRMYGRDPRASGGAPMGQQRDPRFSSSGMSADRDMRAGRGGNTQSEASSVTASAAAAAVAASGLSSCIAGDDQEKAALIMQVLQLSDEQVAALSAEQRHSISMLKQQIAAAKHN